MILFNKNINIIRVIGIHAGLNEKKNLGFGTFMAKIFANKLTFKIITIDGSCNYLITCNDIDNISVVEEKIIAEYPHLDKKNIFFVTNGVLLDKSATLIENKIRKNDIILIVKQNNEDFSKI